MAAELPSTWRDCAVEGLSSELPARAGRRVHFRGTVQGVGFRPWIYRTAVAAQVTGRVWNDSSGVYVEAFGSPDALNRFLGDRKSTRLNSSHT